jgi:hypothetical protein
LTDRAMRRISVMILAVVSLRYATPSRSAPGGADVSVVRATGRVRDSETGGAVPCAQVHVVWQWASLQSERVGRTMTLDDGCTSLPFGSRLTSLVAACSCCCSRNRTRRGLRGGARIDFETEPSFGMVRVEPGRGVTVTCQSTRSDPPGTSRTQVPRPSRLTPDANNDMAGTTASVRTERPPPAPATHSHPARSSTPPSCPPSRYPCTPATAAHPSLSLRSHTPPG